MDRAHGWVPNELVASADLNEVQDRAASLYDVAATHNGHGPRLWSQTGTVLQVQGPSMMSRGSVTTAVRFDALNGVVDPAALPTPVVLGPNAWYYVYLINIGSRSAPNGDFEISTTGPDTASRAFKSGDGSRLYLGCFLTDGSNNIRPFRCEDGRFLYEFNAALTAGTGTTTGSFADVDLSPFLPPHARVARLLSVVASPSFASPSRVRRKGATNAGVPLHGASTYFECETDSNRFVQYDAAGATSVTLYVQGFYE